MISVTRYSFFKGPRGENIRFTEHSPRVEEHDHSVCDCTKNVAERPKGTPKQITQLFTLTLEPIGELRPEFDLGTKRLIFYWGPPPVRNKAGFIQIELNDSYANANFQFRQGERSVKMSIAPQGYCTPERIDDCFFADLFVGNRIDVSTLMNGWRPSRIVPDPLGRLKIEESDVWVHACCFGDEEMRLFFDVEEKRLWQRVMDDAELIESRMDLYQKSFDVTVDELRERVEKDSLLLNTANSIIRALAPIVEQAKDLPTPHTPASLCHTDLFRLGNEIRRAVRETNLRRSHGQEVS